MNIAVFFEAKELIESFVKLYDFNDFFYKGELPLPVLSSFLLYVY